MKKYIHKNKMNLFISGLTLIIFIGFTDSAKAQHINITSPTSPITVQDNQSVTVTWYDGNIQSVDILLWAGNSPVFYLAQDVSSSGDYGSYTWTVPDHFPKNTYEIWVLKSGVNPINPNGGPYDISAPITVTW